MKRFGIKTIIALGIACIGLAHTAPAAPLIYDEFNYADGALLVTGAPTWVISGSATANPVQVGGASLVYAGLGRSESANNSVTLVSDGNTSPQREEVLQTFPDVTSGALYFSFLLNVTSAPTLNTGATALVALREGTGTNVRGNVSITGGTVAGTFQLAISHWSTNFANMVKSTDLTAGTTYFVVLKTTLSAPSVTTLYLNPVAGAVEPAATLTYATTNDSDYTGVAMSGIVMRQRRFAGAFTAEIDAVRVADNWADVTPTGVVAADDPNLSVAPTFNVGSVVNTGTIDGNLAISNTGATNGLTITAGSTITGTDAGKFSVVAGSLPLAIAAGNNASLPIRFTPAGATGTFSATLNLASNDTTSATISVALSATATAPTALDFDIYMPKSAFVALTGNDLGTAGTAEPDGVAVTADSTTLYTFDSVSTAVGDQLIDWDGVVSTVIASEATIGGGQSVSENDLTIDAAGNVYALLRWNVASVNRTHLVKVPGGNYGAAVEMVDPALLAGANRIAVDEKNDRIIIGYTSTFGTMDDIAFVAMTATNATPTTLVTGAQLSTALGLAAATDADLSDITVRSDGSIIFAHSFASSTDLAGTLLQITETGSISTFSPSSLLLEAAGYDPGTVNIGNVHLVTLPGDKLLALVPFLTTGSQAFIAIGNAAGTYWNLVATEGQLLADGAIPANTIESFIPEGGGFAVDGSNNVYWSVQASNNIEGIIRMTGLDLALGDPPASAKIWSVFE